MSATGENKRRAALNRPGWYIVFPRPDGAIDEFDRMQAAGFYPLGAGEAVAVPVADVAVAGAGGAIGGTSRRRGPFPVRRIDPREMEEELVILWM